MLSTKHLWLASASAGVLLAAGSPALAQAAPQGSTDTGVSQLQEVVVTARRVTERLQDVPISVSAMGTKELAQRQIQSVADLGDTVPNLSIVGASPVGGAAAVQIRGITSNVLANISIDSSVGHYVDGVYVARQTAAIFDEADLSRLEVYRGPQGTLFGRNVTQGALNFITADPTGSPHAALEGTVGDYNRYRARAMVDLPEWNGLSVRAAYVHDQRDGDIKNPLSGTQVTWSAPFGTTKALKTWRSQDDNSYFLALRYTGIENLTVSYKFDKSDDQDAPPAGQIAGIPSGSSYGGLITTYGLPVSTKALNSLASAFASLTTVHDYGHNLTATYQVEPDITLKSITAYRSNQTSGVADIGGGAARFAPGTYLLTLGGPEVTNQTQVSQELQVLVHEKRFDVTGGVYAFNEWGLDHSATISGLLYGPPFLPFSLGGKPVSTSGVNTLNALDQFLSTDETANNQSYAAYLHADIRVTDDFDLSGGVRYSKDQRRTTSAEINPQTFSLVTGLVRHYDGDNVSYDVTGTYTVMPAVKTYVRYATGYLSGGVIGINSFKPETTQAVEVGLKSEWLDHRLRINTDYFHVTTQNFQVYALTANGGAALVNEPGYTSDGVEWESVFVPVRGLNLQWDLGYNHINYVDGRRILSPAFNTNFAAEYDAEKFSTGAYLSLRVDANYRSSYYGQVACGLTEPVSSCRVPGGGGYNPNAPLPAAFLASQGYPANGTHAYLANLDKAEEDGNYWVINLRGSIVDIPLRGGHARASIWVKNLFDERGAEDSANVGTYVAQYFEPSRTVGLDLAWNY